MDATRKTISEFEWKAEREGAFKAVISTFNVVDKDGDVTLPGAFVPGMTVAVSPWGHQSFEGALPVGDATITTDGARAFAEGQFYTDTPHGKAAYMTVKRLSDKGIQQWSYGFRPKLVSTARKDLETWPGAKRILKEVQTFEVSPVLVGAGEGVFTQSIKSSTGTSNLDRLAAAMEAYFNEHDGKAGAVISRANWTRLHAAVSELMAFLTENDPNTSDMAQRAGDQAGKAAGAPPPEVLAAIAQIDLLIDQADELVDALMVAFDIPDPDEDAMSGKAAVDNGAWDGNAAMTNAKTAADYEAICAGRREGDPSLRSTWALPHHKAAGDPPNADGVRNSLSRLPQTQGLINKADAQAHLERHMAAINPDAGKSDDADLFRILERLKEEHERTALMRIDPLVGREEVTV